MELPVCGRSTPKGALALSISKQPPSCNGPIILLDNGFVGLHALVNKADSPAPEQ